MSCIYGIYDLTTGQFKQACFSSHQKITDVTPPDEDTGVAALPVQDVNMFEMDVTVTPHLLRVKPSE